MCLSQFIGDLSPFQVVVAVVAFATGLYTFYKSFLERARIRVFSADQVGFVISKDGGTTNIHLGINIVNEAIKTGTVHKLEVLVRPPQGEPYRFGWNLFFEYVPGGYAVQKKTDPFPIAVAGKNTYLLFVEFVIIPKQIPIWLPGKYEFIIIGWANKKTRAETPNISTTFHVELKPETALRLNEERPDRPILAYAPVIEWN